MFTIDQIKEAHSKVKSGADFPSYVQALIQLGVTAYETFVADGHTAYFGNSHYRIQSDSKYAPIAVNDNSDTEEFKHRLKIHQAGKTDYPTFCNDSAKAGVEKWGVDMATMTCTYYDKAGNKMLVEQIPTA